jgi:alanyl-tRNA synthetase
MQHVHSNYEIDLFQALIKAAARETSSADLNSPSLKVLADHIRACSFLIADGVIPSNEGRGYVLRRIIRRAIRHGYKLGARAAFFHKMVPDLVGQMGAAYPDLASAQGRVMDILRQEEERFFVTIEHGMAILDGELAAIASVQPRGSIVAGGSISAGTHISASGNVVAGDSIRAGRDINAGGEVKAGVLSGETAFKLHDTYGFPLDLTADVCRERGVTVDDAAFNAAMARQKEQARAAGKFKMAANLEYAGKPTTFHGYDTLEHKGNILALYKDGVAVKELAEGDMGVVVLDDTPFYAESGGQVGDRGELRGAGGIFAVEDTQKIQATVFGHHGVLKTGKLVVGGAITAKVDMQARASTERNHSVTHLMHKALREVPMSSTRTSSPYFSPNSIIAPVFCASSIPITRA